MHQDSTGNIGTVERRRSFSADRLVEKIGTSATATVAQSSVNEGLGEIYQGRIGNIGAATQTDVIYV